MPWPKDCTPILRINQRKSRWRKAEKVVNLRAVLALAAISNQPNQSVEHLRGKLVEIVHLKVRLVGRCFVGQVIAVDVGSAVPASPRPVMSNEWAATIIISAGSFCMIRAAVR